jgi:hypothetical protein
VFTIIHNSNIQQNSPNEKKLSASNIPLVVNLPQKLQVFSDLHPRADRRLLIYHANDVGIL